MRIFYLAGGLLFALTVTAQSKDQLRTVISNTNVAELQQLRSKFETEFIKREERIQAYLLAHPEVKRRYTKNGTEREIYDVINGEVFFYSTSNFNSAVTARADQMYAGGSLGLNVSGQDMVAGVWDSGSVWTMHDEFPDGKVTLINSGSYSDHATHVTGTIVAQGNQPNLRGIAFDASAYSYDWSDDYTEMATAAGEGLLVSNHSYWIGSELATWIFGAYDNRARNFDLIATSAPYYLAVTAAGNDRNDFADAIIGSQLNNKFGYDLLRGMQNAKNFLTVGAVHQVLNYTGPESVSMANFSSWGPTDDGRIKPEIVAKGVGVRSTLTGSNTENGIMQGTSMASPAVAGVALLMQQHHYNLFNDFMRAATLKGLLLHTADEAGWEDGPDYEYGWGLVNAERAATVLNQKAANLATVEELVLSSGQTYSITVNVDGPAPLMASISWTDPAAPNANTGTVDPSANYLVNDLDLRITKTGGATHFPWTLDPSNPFEAAVRTQDNFRDNFEKVQVDNPGGEYTITVSHKNSLSGGQQAFSLIVSGVNLLSSRDVAAQSGTLSIYPNPVNDVLNYHSDQFDVKSVTIYDVTGKTISTSVEHASKTVNVGNLESGVYFIHFNDGNNTEIRRFIKQ